MYVSDLLKNYYTYPALIINYHSNEHIFSLNQGKQGFDNLMKRLSKKKKKYKKATRSGSGSREVKQAETELKKNMIS